MLGRDSRLQMQTNLRKKRGKIVHSAREVQELDRINTVA